MRYLAIISALLSAALWFWSATINIPPMTWDGIDQLPGVLKRVGRINGAAALFSGIAAIASAFSGAG
jgi:hypothetical protein